MTEPSTEAAPTEPPKGGCPTCGGGDDKKEEEGPRQPAMEAHGTYGFANVGSSTDGRTMVGGNFPPGAGVSSALCTTTGAEPQGLAFTAGGNASLPGAGPDVSMMRTYDLNGNVSTTTCIGAGAGEQNWVGAGVSFPTDAVVPEAQTWSNAPSLSNGDYHDELGQPTVPGEGTGDDFFTQ